MSKKLYCVMLLALGSIMLSCYDPNSPTLNQVNPNSKSNVGYLRSSADAVANTIKELKDFVENSDNENKTIFVNQINITDADTGLLPCTINASGIHIVGDINSSYIKLEHPLCAEISSDVGHVIPVLKAESYHVDNCDNNCDIYYDNLVIDGIDFRGPCDEGNLRKYLPDSDYLKYRSRACAIQIINSSNSIVNNCKIQNWMVGVWTQATSTLNLPNIVSNCEIINNNYFRQPSGDDRSGQMYGYGVGIFGENAYTKVLNNVFCGNKHNVTASGHAGQNTYIAKNEIKEDKLQINASFDTHSGYDETYDPSVGGYLAGARFTVENNTWDGVPNKFKPAVQCRGIPSEMFSVRNNDFGSLNQFQGITNELLYKFPYMIQVERDKPWHIKVPSKNVEFVNDFTIPWLTPGLIKVGDLDGDNKDELVTTDGIFCYVAKIKNDVSKTTWSYLNSFSEDLSLNSYTSDETISRYMDPSLISVGRFNSPVSPGIFLSYGNKWYLSQNGTGKWTEINTSVQTVPNLGFGDFNGDGKTDVLAQWQTNNVGNWYVSYSGQGNWIELNTSNCMVYNLGIGDFYGDGKCDVMNATGGNWYISNNAHSPWAAISIGRKLYIKTTNMRFGNFDNDAQKSVDVFITSPQSDGTYLWEYYSVQKNKWVTLGSSNISIDNIIAGDFDGNGFCDIIAYDPSAQKWAFYPDGKSNAGLEIFGNPAEYTTTLKEKNY